MEVEKKIIKIERFYEDGSSDFVTTEYLQNFLTNLDIANGFAVSRSYIQYSPVNWTKVSAFEKLKAEVDNREDTYVRAYNTIKNDIEQYDNKINRHDLGESEHEDAIDLCELYHQMRIGKYSPDL